MDIWQLKYFIQVCNDKSFSKASKNLHISQQGLSKIIKNIEDEIGKKLFYRSAKGTIPTDYGLLLLEKSQKVVEDFDTMVDYFNEKSHAKKGSLSIGLPYMLYTNSFAVIISKFMEIYPEIHLKIVNLGSYECEKYIKDDMLDIAFVSKPFNTEDYKYIHVICSDINILANKNNSIARKMPVSFKNLEDKKIIIQSPEYKLRQIFLNTCQQYNFEPNIIFTTSQQDLVIEMVALDKGIAIIPDCISEEATKYSDKVCSIPFDIPIKMELGFIIKKDRKLDYIVNSFIDFSLQFFKDDNLSILK